MELLFVASQKKLKLLAPIHRPPVCACCWTVLHMQGLVYKKINPSPRRQLKPKAFLHSGMQPSAHLEHCSS